MLLGEYVFALKLLWFVLLGEYVLALKLLWFVLLGEYVLALKLLWFVLLGEYVLALKRTPRDPLISLCIGLTFIHIASQKFSSRRHCLIMQVCVCVCVCVCVLSRISLLVSQRGAPS